MKTYRCKCGKMQAYTSMGVPQCLWCKECNSNPAAGPAGHRDKQKSHMMIQTTVGGETDDGAVKGTLTICVYCRKTKKELTASNEPMEAWQKA